MNRIWIELEKPRDAVHGEEICALANRALRRLSGDSRTRAFWWSVHENRYCLGDDGGYKVLEDNGEWFNLDYLGREIE